MKKHGFTTALLIFIFFTSCDNKKNNPANGTIKAGNFNLYYERTGKGDAILLLHAGLQDHAMWAEQVKALSANYEVVTVDLPYHGKTTGSDTVTLAADIIKILLDSLQLQKVSVAGLSMGATVAQDFIIAYPGRVNKAFLIAAGVNGLEEKIPMDSVSMVFWQQFEQALNQKDTVQAAKEFTKAWAEGVYRRGDSLKAPVSQQVYAVTLNTLRLHKMEGWPVLQDKPKAIESLAGIRIPVLIIDGDKDLPYIATSCEYLQKNIPNARRVIIKDVAHMLNIEKPAELNNLMIGFLKQ